MSAIRPDLPTSLPVQTPAASQMRAAQAAFFRAALNEVAATSVAGTTAAAPVAREAEPTRTQRPGALLDIRV